MTISTWDEFEDALSAHYCFLVESFLSIHNADEFLHRDFYSLVAYINSTRPKFAAKVSKLFVAGEPVPNSSEPAELAGFPLLHQILESPTATSLDDLVEKCIKLWKCRYPPMKEVFILPLVSQLMPRLLESHQAQPLLEMIRKRLSKGKLFPFEASISIAKALQLDPNAIDFIDDRLSALQQILHDAQGSRNRPDPLAELNVLESYSGCHCD